MTDVPAAVGAAIGSAVGYAVASVLQHRAAQLAPESAGTDLRLVAHLATRPVWLAGLVFALVGLVLHGLALSLGQLALVQPVLLSGLLFALPASILVQRGRPSLSEWSWAVLLIGGIAGFVLAAQPTSGHVPSDTERLAAVVAAGGVVTAAAMACGRSWPRHRAAVYGLGAGVAYGLTAALIKQTTIEVGHPRQLAGSWEPYALVAIGTSALLLNQAAYRAGPLSASLPPMTMAEPVVAVVMGVLIFDEHLSHGALALAAEVVCAGTVTVSTIRLAHRSPGPQVPPGTDRTRRGHRAPGVGAPSGRTPQP